MAYGGVIYNFNFDRYFESCHSYGYYGVRGFYDGNKNDGIAKPA